MLNKLINKFMNTEETVTPEVTPVEAPVENANTIDKTPSITVNDQSGNLAQTFTNVDEAIAFAGENGYQVNVG